MTFVDRATHCVLNWAVAWQVSDENLQQMLDDTLPAHWYYSDMLAAYQELAYDFGLHFPMDDKSQTYSVEADNAELRHYLTRLNRRSRCFSRSLKWLNRYLKAFAHAWNQRQLHNRAYPFDKKHVIEFVCLQD